MLFQNLPMTGFNRRPLVSEATALPTVPQALPKFKIVMKWLALNAILMYDWIPTMCI